MTSRGEEEVLEEGVFDLKEMKKKLELAERLASNAMMMSPAAKRRLAARKLEFEPDFVPPKQVLLYLVRMGSFTSATKIENEDTADDDVIPEFSGWTRESALERCRDKIATSALGPLLARKFRFLRQDAGFVRVLQWNVLSQALGEEKDNFSHTPAEALNWSFRRYLMLQEILERDPDVICLEEVDHFRFLHSALSSLGYKGNFFPKPDSPCIYLEGNNGPDGSAIFYRTSRFELMCLNTRILEVWGVQSNQVALACVLKDKSTGSEFSVAVTHLKAKSGALLATLRDNQGKDLLDWLVGVSEGRPLVLSGDFNAEPTEPVYKTTVNHRLKLKSAYCVDGKEPDFTTWKVRDEGETCHTIDYIFHTPEFEPVAVLDFPEEADIGPNRVPSLTYPSDHFSLVADFKLTV